MSEELNKILKNSSIRLNPQKFNKLTINFDEVDFDVVEITRFGTTVVYPAWEFFQVLRDNDK